MLYKVNDKEYINLTQLVSVAVRASITEGYYCVFALTNGYEYFGDTLETKAECIMEINNITQLMVDIKE